MKRQLYNIYFTIFLSIFAWSLLIPVTPFVIRSLGAPDYYVWIGTSLYFLWMFLGGMIFGKISDNIGRRNAMYITVGLDIIGYSLFYISHSALWILIARLFLWFGGGTFPIGQAYIADNSSVQDKTKNIAMTGAIFGTAFVIWPALWGFLFTKFGIHMALIPILLLLGNIASISFHKNHISLPGKLKFNLSQFFHFNKMHFSTLRFLIFLIDTLEPNHWPDSAIDTINIWLWIVA